MPRRARLRLRIALGLVLCLLFQQVAMAAYACTRADMPPEPAAMVEDCADMGMPVAPEVPAVCAEHCTPDLPVVPDGSALHVPPLALAPVAFADMAMPGLVQAGLRAEAPFDPSDPPPRLRYCSLLI